MNATLVSTEGWYPSSWRNYPARQSAAYADLALLAQVEARLSNAAPVIAIADSNSDPEGIDYVIPCNDDAIRSIRLITDKIAEAALEGQNRRESSQADQMRGGRYSQPEPELDQVDEAAAEEPVA